MAIGLGPLSRARVMGTEAFLAEMRGRSRRESEEAFRTVVGLMLDHGISFGYLHDAFRARADEVAREIRAADGPDAIDAAAIFP